MASVPTWSEGNGANAGTETASRAEANWKNVDDSTTAYTASPVVAGTNSFSKYQAINFGTTASGAFNSLSSLSYKVSTATPLDNASGAGNLTVKAAVITAAAPSTPSATATGDSNASTTTPGTNTANFVNTNTWTSVFAAGTATGGPSSTTKWYGQAYRTQLVVGASAAPGDIASVLITATWTES